jgi:hypothetical protein
MYLVNDWTALSRGKPQPAIPLNATGTAELVKFVERPSDRWGEYHQDERECYVIFKVGDRFFKKTGDQSSYGDEIDWSYGKVTEVHPKTVTETVYE